MTPYSVEWTIAWAMALAITLAAETPVYAWLLDRPRRRGVLVGMTASLITHPVLWFVVSPWLWVRHLWTTSTWIAVEIVITLVEGVWVALWYRRTLRLRDAVVIAAAANLASIVVGEIIRPFVPYL